MTKLMKDPLLTFSRGLLLFFIGMFGFGMIMVVIGLGTILTVKRGEVLAHLTEAGASGSDYWLIVGCTALVVALIFLGIRFMLELRGIVGSVDKGDPFAAVNADRLSRMGWISLAGQVLAIPTGALVTHLMQFADEPDQMAQTDIGFSGGGLLLILTLFILARVFRKGTEMRDELEGTV